MRDDFPKQTITEIAKGVGYRCSNPECARPTVGANAAQDGIITIGVAAHICAASLGGPRYNASQTQDARRGRDNGIWLCQNCGKLVDADARKFTVELLTGWKRDAQYRAFCELVAPGVPASEEFTRIDSIIAEDNASTADSVDTLFAKIHAAANADLAAYRRAPIWSGESIELTLRIYDDTIAPPFSISKLPSALEVAPEVTIVAPGTGKTTTLLQLATHVLAANSIVPLYFSLGEWSAGSSSLLASLHQRSAFKDMSEDECAGSPNVVVYCYCSTVGTNSIPPRASHSGSNSHKFGTIAPTFASSRRPVDRCSTSQRRARACDRAAVRRSRNGDRARALRRRRREDR